MADSLFNDILAFRLFVPAEIKKGILAIVVAPPKYESHNPLFLLDESKSKIPPPY